MINNKSAYYKLKKYTIVTEAKFQVGQLWIQCIVYKDENGLHYVREKTDFEEKFSVPELKL